MAPRHRPRARPDFALRCRMQAPPSGGHVASRTWPVVQRLRSDGVAGRTGADRHQAVNAPGGRVSHDGLRSEVKRSWILALAGRAPPVTASLPSELALSNQCGLLPRPSERRRCGGCCKEDRALNSRWLLLSPGFVDARQVKLPSPRPGLQSPADDPRSQPCRLGKSVFATREWPDASRHAILASSAAAHSLCSR